MSDAPRIPENTRTWHWLHYTGAMVKVAQEVWEHTANGYWCRSTQTRASLWCDLAKQGWVYIAPIQEPQI